MPLSGTVARQPLQPAWCFAASLFLVLGTSLHAAAGPTAPAATAGGTAVVRHFIAAMQRRDFRAALEDTHACRQAVAAIKKNNPAVLWKQLVDEYYSPKVAALAQNPKFWQSYSEALGASMGDSTSFVRASIALLPAGAKWSVGETRSEQISDSLQWGPYRKLTAFVTVEYPSLEAAPESNNHALKQTILAFTVHGSTHGILSVSQVNKADRFWPVPAPDQTQAAEMARGFLADKVRAFIKAGRVDAQGAAGERWYGVALPNYDSPAVGEYRRLFENAGFKLRDWKISPGWGANGGMVSPPASWHQYEHIGQGSEARYYLEEEVEITGIALAQHDNTATLTVHVVRKGCNEVCALLGSYWASPIVEQMASEPGAHYNRFFMTFWEGNRDANGSRNVTLPEQDDRAVTFEWRPRQGWSPVSEALSSAAAPPRPLAGSRAGTAQSPPSAGASSFARSWRGWITDEDCGARGAAAGASHHDCAVKCAARGRRLLLYSAADAKLYQLDDQASASQHAGEEVLVTGNARGDSISVASIRPAG